MTRAADENWAKFFEEHEDYTVDSRYYENRRAFTLEELYQAFKARLKDETMVLSIGDFGSILDKTDTLE